MVVLEPGFGGEEGLVGGGIGVGHGFLGWNGCPLESYGRKCG